MRNLELKRDQARRVSWRRSRILYVARGHIEDGQPILRDLAANCFTALSLRVRLKRWIWIGENSAEWKKKREYCSTFAVLLATSQPD